MIFYLLTSQTKLTNINELLFFSLSCHFRIDFNEGYFCKKNNTRDILVGSYKKD